MISLRSDGFRWFLVLPLAVAATVAAQLVATAVAHSAIVATVGAEWSSAWWGAKAAASPVMGVAFVASAWWVAPSRKREAAALALGAVAVWAALLIVTSLGEGAAWPAAIGGLGFAGGLAAFSHLRRKD